MARTKGSNSGTRGSRRSKLSSSRRLPGRAPVAAEDTITSATTTPQDSATDTTSATSISQSSTSEHEIPKASAVRDEPKSHSSTSQSTAADEPVDDRFKYPKLIGRGAKEIYVYPYSDTLVAEHIRDHWHELANVLRRSIAADPELRTYEKEIMFLQLMCGHDHKQARPAVVVVCNDDISDLVRRRLNNPQLHDDWNLCMPFAQSSIMTFFKRTRKTMDVVHTRPPLPLYVYAGEPVRLYYGNLTLPRQSTSFDTLPVVAPGPMSLVPRPKITDTLCSASIQSQRSSRQATIACIISTENNYYGLTSAHAFTGEGAYSGYLNTARAGIQPGWTEKSYESNVRFPTATYYEELETPDLDWALTELDPALLVRNSYTTQTTISVRQEVIGAASTAPESGTDVLILTSSVRPIAGTLYTEEIYRSRPRQAFTALWSVRIADGKVLNNGASGALVVGASSGIAYGYVVAVDILGKIHVVPLSAALKQIAAFLSDGNISLPHHSQLDLLRLQKANEETSSQRARPRADDHVALPFAEYEERYVLAEILKQSQISPGSLLDYIQQLGIDPAWTNMALPLGRSVTSCQSAMQELEKRTYSLKTEAEAKTPSRADSEHSDGPLSPPLLPDHHQNSKKRARSPSDNEQQSYNAARGGIRPKIPWSGTHGSTNKAPSRSTLRADNKSAENVHKSASMPPQTASVATSKRSRNDSLAAANDDSDHGSGWKNPRLLAALYEISDDEPPKPPIPKTSLAKSTSDTAGAGSSASHQKRTSKR